MFKIGYAEKVVDVPLFAELYGYGPFQGRRNLGTHDELYCRVFAFRDDANKRAMIVYTDTCTIPTHYARVMRSELSQAHGIDPECIAFVATHTHCGPLLGVSGGVGFGEPHPKYQENWFTAVRETAVKACKSEVEISYVEAGKAPLTRKLGKNRVEVEKNATDEHIRWAKFVGPDGEVKVLLHNHGIHGICMNGDMARFVSADWMGEVNRMIKAEGLAEMPLFLLGACGDVNTYTSCALLKNDTAANLIAGQYIADLKKSMEQGGEKFTDLSISGILRTKLFPCEEKTLDELKAEEEQFRTISKQHSDRLKEVIILKERNHDFSVRQDLQVLKIGPLSFFFIPGEYFVEDGASILAQAQSSHSFVATVSNGNGAYYPSESDMKRYPDVASFHTCKNNCAFGFYEIYCCYPGLRMRYSNNIASFVASNLLNLEKSI